MTTGIHSIVPLCIGASAVMAGALLAGIGVIRAVALMLSVWCVLFWLPALAVQVRFWLLTAINGEEGKQFPDKSGGDATFKFLYNHTAARVRSRQGSVGITGECVVCTYV